MWPSFYAFAEPFEYKKTAGTTIDDFFLRMRLPANLTFTVGLLLLPFVWVGSLALSWIKRRETAFAVAFISATLSFGYILFNSILQVFLDRYHFPIYISAWIAIFAFVYGLCELFVRKKHPMCRRRSRQDN